LIKCLNIIILRMANIIMTIERSVRMFIFDNLTYTLFAYAVVTTIAVVDLTLNWLNSGLYKSYRK
jgi:hypothetical protein